MRTIESIVSIAVLFIAAPTFAATPTNAASAVATCNASPSLPPPPLSRQRGLGLQVERRAVGAAAELHVHDHRSQERPRGYKAHESTMLCTGWTVTSNLPKACYVHTIYRGPVATRVRPTQSPDKPTYSVWAFSFADGKWVKDDKYSWTTSDPVAGLDYAKKVAAVAGWTTTTNCPPPVPKAQRYVDGGMVHGAENYSMRINIGGFSISIPYSALQNAGGGSDGSSFYDNFSTYGDTSDIQNTIATQDMINQQTANDNEQELINEQNFQNTENDINNEQNTINAQANP